MHYYPSPAETQTRVARRLPHWQPICRRLYGTSRASATSTAWGSHVKFTRCSCSRLVQRPAPISLDRCLACWVSAQHVVPCIRLTQRHGHTYFCEEPTCSFTAFYEVSRRYAGDGSLRLERHSPQPWYGSLRFKRRSVGDGSSRFGRRPPQLRQYSDGRSLRLVRRSSQPRHGGPGTKPRPPSHTLRSRQTAAPARRSFHRGRPAPSPPGHAVAVGLKCGKATPKPRDLE